MNATPSLRRASRHTALNTLVKSTAASPTGGPKAHPVAPVQSNVLASRWHTGYANECGTRHQARGESNQDAVGLLSQPNGMLVAAVADGVGQGARGDVAARTLVAHWLASPRCAIGQPSASWMTGADAVVKAAVARVSPSPGAATGAAVWLNPDGRGWVTRIGDCRAYHVRHTRLAALLPDQSYAELGEAPPGNIASHHPARMAGTGCAGLPDVMPFYLAPGEGMLLCSDGVHHGGCDRAFVAAAQAILLANAQGRQNTNLHARSDVGTQAQARALVKSGSPGGDDASTVLIWCNYV